MSIYEVCFETDLRIVFITYSLDELLNWIRREKYPEPVEIIRTHYNISVVNIVEPTPKGGGSE